jgi:arylsulfatase A-like enzyme
MENNQLILCGIGACLALTNTQAVEQKKEVTNPNVLFIIMDDMNDWIGALRGNNQVKTPNLDRLAARGIVFSNAYTVVPLSNPSRAALMTGKQPFVTGVYNNHHEISRIPESNNSLFMPQHFKNNGYTTLAAGKIFHTKPAAPVMESMWDDMAHLDGGYGPWVKNNKLPKHLIQQWTNFEAWTGPDTDFPDVRNTQRIIEFLGESHKKPFFAAMGFYRPHTPYTAPKRYFDLYPLEDIKQPDMQADDLEDIPGYAINNFIRSRKQVHLLRETGNYYEQMLKAYLACVSFADDYVGRILDALDKSAYADNTCIVLIGDNGYHHGEKDHWGKVTLWREANHVPFIIVPPLKNNDIRPATCESPVSLIDIYPTLVDFCGLSPVENQLAGNNLTPLLLNPQSKWDKPAISTFLPGNFVVHQGNWNYLRYNDGSHELYNLGSDENEWINLADQPAYKSMVDSLSKFLPTTWHKGPENLQAKKPAAKTPQRKPAAKRPGSTNNPRNATQNTDL